MPKGFRKEGVNVQHVNKVIAGAWIVVAAALAVLLLLIGSISLPKLSLSDVTIAKAFLGTTFVLCLGLGMAALGAALKR